MSTAKGRKTSVLPLERKANPSSLADDGAVHLTGAGCHNVAYQHTEQDGNNLDHTLAPDVTDNDDDNGNQGHPPATENALNRSAGKDKTYRDNNGTCDDRWEQLHNTLDAKGFDAACQNKIKQSGGGHTDASVG